MFQSLLVCHPQCSYGTESSPIVSLYKANCVRDGFTYVLFKKVKYLYFKMTIVVFFIQLYKSKTFYLKNFKLLKSPTKLPQ